MTDLISSEAKKYKQFKFIGIDLDIHAIEQAKTVALMNGLFHACEFYKMNAWELSFENEFDLLSSNGLNIYEKCDTKVTKLYQKFFNALKRKGTLILSTITPPPTLCEDSTWNMNVIHKENLLLQKVIFSDIIEAQFQCLRSVKQTQTQLASVGFREQEVFSDTQGMFVTIIARK